MPTNTYLNRVNDINNIIHNTVLKKAILSDMAILGIDEIYELALKSTKINYLISFISHNEDKIAKYENLIHLYLKGFKRYILSTEFKRLFEDLDLFNSLKRIIL